MPTEKHQPASNQTVIDSMKASSTYLHLCCYCPLMFLLSRIQTPTSAAYFVPGRIARTTRTRRMASSSSSSTSTKTNLPAVSSRIQTTLDPCVVLMKDLIGKYAEDWQDRGGIYSLAQGVVWWPPPSQCQQALREALASDDNPLHLYGPDEGMPELRAKLQEKVATENGLRSVQTMVTVGANQAFVNCVLTLLSPQDRAVVFTPYYFNHYMALQMTISQDNILEGPTSDEGLPDLDWLEEQFRSDDDDKHKIQMVVLTNPGNPTGTLLSRSFVQRAVDLCRRYSAWLILDTTYEYFVPEQFDACFDEPHCVHIFSLSKAYALAGYRCGYMTTHPDSGLYEQILKVQDTIPIAPSRISQVAALAALEAGRAWVRERIATLETGREAMLQALAPLDQVMGGDGAMYLMAKLPAKAADDREVADRLVRDFGVAVIPGSFCGFPGWIRVCYANLPPDKCVEAAKRLGRGLEAILSGGCGD